MNAAQREAVEHFRAYGVPATWLVGESTPAGDVEVFALGEGFVWALLIEPNGTAHTSEAPLGPFSTGIEV